MKVFDIRKFAQQSSSINIITFAKNIVSKNADELSSLGLNTVAIDKLRILASKSSMSEITMKDLSVIAQLPASLRTEEYQRVKKHAVEFVEKRTTEEYASASAATPSVKTETVVTPQVTQEQKPENKPQPELKPEPQAEARPKPVKAPVPVSKKIQKFDVFEFLDKSNDKEWKNLLISPEIIDFNRELIFLFNNIGILFETKSVDGKAQNIIKSITKEQYKDLLHHLKSKGWDISKADPDAGKHLIASKERLKSAEYAEVKARSVLEETKGNWMYEIKVPNINDPGKDIQRQSEIIECITFAFIGMTDDIRATRELEDEFGNKIDRTRLCKVRPGTDLESTEKGWYVRGDPSDFQRFADICNARKIENSQLASMVIADFYAGKFYDPKKKKQVDPKLARFEGIIDGDGYDSEDSFLKEAQDIARQGLASKERQKNPEADVSGLSAYPMQLDGIKFLYSRTHAILGDETGVGKTMQAIVAGHLRLKTDTMKSNKDMKAVVITKSSVVPQYKRDIALFTGLEEEYIWTGDDLFDYLLKYDHPTKILDANGNPKIPIPKWKWCILNYEKFAIPPRTNIIRNIITRKQNILIAYDAIMNKAMQYAEQFAEKVFATGMNAVKGIKQDSPEYAKRLQMAISTYIVSQSNNGLPSLYLNGRDSTWYDEKMLTNNMEGLAKSTAYNILHVSFSSPKNISSVSDLVEKVRQNLEAAKRDKTEAIQKFVASQELRLQKTSELDDLLYRYQQAQSNENTPLEDIQELEQEIQLLKKINNNSGENGDSNVKPIRWGEDGKRKILTAYFAALAKLGVLNVVVLDEVHTVKNGDPDDRAENFDDEHDANFTTFNTQIVTNGANNVWGASATIIANREQDLYNQLRAINSPLGDMNYGSFITQLSSSLSKGNQSISIGTAIRDALVQSKIYIQRSKQNMVEQDPNRPPLPPQVTHTNDVEDPEAINAFRIRKAEEIKEATMRGSLDSRNAGLVLYGINRRSLAKAKANSTVEFSLDALRKGQRVGIFTDDIESGEMIQSGIINGLKSFPTSSPFYGKGVYFLNGKEPPSNRMIHVDAFMKDPALSPYAAMIISFKAGGTGLSMENSANVIIFNDLPQTPMLDTQAKGRFYRINSKEESHVYYLILPVEEDEKLFEILQKKIRIAEEISKLTLEDIELVMQGNSRSEFRLQNLAKLAALQAEYQAAEAEERNFRKQSLKKSKTALSNSWYKVAGSLYLKW